MQIKKSRGSADLDAEFDVAIDVEKPDRFSLYISEDSAEVDGLKDFMLRREGNRLELASGGYKVEVDVKDGAARVRVSSPCGDAAVDFEPAEYDEEWRIREGCLEFTLSAMGDI